MEQPLGFVAQVEYGKVCRLHNAIYGFGKFNDIIDSLTIQCSLLLQSGGRFYQQFKWMILLRLLIGHCQFEDISINQVSNQGLGSTQDQLAEIFTKPLSRARLELLCYKLGLYHIYTLQLEDCYEGYCVISLGGLLSVHISM